MFDYEGQALIRASAIARLMHDDGAPYIHELQGALAVACREYALKRGGMRWESMLNEMADAIVSKVDEIRRA